MPQISRLFLAALLGSVVSVLAPRSALAVGKQGEAIQTDTFGVSLFTHNFDTKVSRDISKTFNSSEFVGIHAYVVDRVRVGMNLQLTERVWPDLPPGASRLQRLGLLPQVGWNFYGPLFSSLVVGVVPRTDGKAHLNLTLQAVFGASFAIAGRFRWSVAGEVPWTYYDQQMLGVTALTGISIRL
ncbi:MAG TPA: hypothetical protein VHW01_08775 [Polyangiaceae bacterium]|nr:hypothetical protein [Polyangiaceae bacterium]